MTVTRPARISSSTARRALSGADGRAEPQRRSDGKACIRQQASDRPRRLQYRLVNKSSLPHNLTVAKGAKVLAQTKTISGSSATTTANLTPGEYVFYCSVDAHRAAGMQGTLTVT